MSFRHMQGSMVSLSQIVVNFGDIMVLGRPALFKRALINLYRKKLCWWRCIIYIQQQALACSYDITTGTLYRETVPRVPSQIVDKMHSLQRVRLGLKNPFGASNVNKVHHPQPTPPANGVHPPPQTTQPQNEEESSSSPLEEMTVLGPIHAGPAGNKVA